MTIALTKAERVILEAIWNAPDKQIAFDDLHKAAHTTKRGFRTVINRMRYMRLIEQSENVETYRYFMITLRGARSLGVSFDD